MRLVAAVSGIRYRVPNFIAREIISVPNTELECGPMPNVMVALPNTGGALCSTPAKYG